MLFKERSKNSEIIDPREELRILVIDDQPEMLVFVNSIITQVGMRASLAVDAFVARQMMSEENFDFVILDWQMPKVSGGECLTTMDMAIEMKRKARKPVPYVTFSGLSTEVINVPSTLYLRRVGHWQKPMTVAQIAQRLLKTVAGF